MARQLRSRASRPNYAALFQYDDAEDDGAGPSTRPVVEEEGDSGSDFAPDEVPDQAAVEEDDLVDEDAEAEEDDDVPAEEPSREPSMVLASDAGKPSTARGTPKPKAMPGLSSKPRTYALPSIHHRHRALPLFDRPGPVERLMQRPAPFGPPRIAPTSSWSVNPTILERISKAWGFNVGPGPLWDLLEDRAWFKESLASGGLGYKQYLAVALFPSNTHSPVIGVRAQRPMHACIQIWSLSRSADAMDVDEITDVDNGDDLGEMRCEMVVCIESGPAFELKWCPLPSNDPAEEIADPTRPRKLGVLAGTFEDGSLSLYTIPDPASLYPDGNQPSQPICGTVLAITERTHYSVDVVRLSEPLLRFELEETMCWGMDWANSEVIAVGCTNGSIAVYNIADALKRPDERTPTHYFVVHQSAIRSLAWVRAPGVSASGGRCADNPTVIVSGGYDGLECVTDIRDPVGNAMNRTRDVVNSMTYSTWCGGPVTIDHENIIKAYSLSPNMLGRGQTILEPDGPAWSLAASDYHPQLAVGVADGSLLTSNTLRATRRGGANPFLVHRIYQLDYNRKDKEWRMLERFLPKEMPVRSNNVTARAPKDAPDGTGAWPAQVGVQRAVWNSGNGLCATPFLASSTGSGLCRVDWLLGRWNKDRIPYYSVDGIRGEVAVDGKEEDDDDDD
ncbi:hypothetical protein EVJ58_g2459 [Rhodofomes roseus]|uniref:Uncharacterized protein n=1 Tax=Rhodofomes roseus TaxID=34475 RepID=A0A4Y9YQ35_9APHY|nr:hypothetical protein EVJ58_g2459 [Rhodofomes roseus]